MKQAPHFRTSKRGHKFRAGRGMVKRKVRRASQLRRDIIRKTIRVEATPQEKEQLVRIFEKADPLAWKEYKEIGYPKIETIQNLMEKKDAFALADISSNQIEMDKRPLEYLYYEPFSSISKRKVEKPEVILESSKPIIPKELLRHEIQHLKDRPIDSGERKISEDAALWRSLFDIKKYKKPQKMLDDEIRLAFEGPILKEDVRWKKFKRN